MEHSVFNIEIEEAYARGIQFFTEYLKFHDRKEECKEINDEKKSKIRV